MIGMKSRKGELSMVSLESRKVWEKQLGSGMEIFLPHIFLTGLTLLLLFLPVPADAIFGSCLLYTSRCV